MAELIQVFKISRPAHRERLGAFGRREAIWCLLFLSPWILGFLVFTVYPVFSTLVMTFTNYDLVQSEPVRFVGLDNYRNLIADPRLGASLVVTLKYALLAIPVGLAVPLALALLMNARNLRARKFFYTLFYMPYIIPVVSTLFIWRGILNPQSGWVNMALKALGVNEYLLPQWTTSTTWVYPALVLMSLWGIGQNMLIMLAGLQGVPTSLYEAARVDGAGPFQTFWHVTLPMVSPVIFMNLILGVISIFQFFVPALILWPPGNGDPGGSTFFFNLYLYHQFFTYHDMAYGATLAWLMFLIIMAVTAILWWTQKYWVYYAGERQE
ncbi:MAG: sugar ABC transporter permease [Chloroflexota bacterium]|nr:MAG: sugar ABC transporter permease [Chloroflexota bacterium]